MSNEIQPRVSTDDDKTTTTTTSTNDGVLGRELSLASGNALKLALSLMATLTVTVSVRFWIPRVLGPDAYGQVTFAESMAVIAFLVVTLGIDTYIAKEHAGDPKAVERFLGGVFVVRAAIGALSMTGMLVALWLMDKTADMTTTVVLFGIFEFTRLGCETLGGVVNTSGRVTRIAFAKPIVKLIWGAVVIVGLVVSPTVETVAAAFVVGEVIRLVTYAAITRKDVGVRFIVDIRATTPIVVASMGYFVNFVIHRVYERIDVQMISVMAGDAETGFYGAAANLALAGLLFIPVVHSVILPMASRIAASNEDSMNSVMRLALRIVLIAGTLPSLMLVLHRDDVVTIVFGEAFAPTASGLATLGFLFPLTYAAVITALHMIQLKRIWLLTRISLVGLIINPAMNYVLIPWGLETMGPGGAGFGAGIATVATECWVVVGSLYVLGRHGVDRALVGALVKLCALSAIVVGIHHFVSPSWGIVAAVPEVIAFAAGTLVLRLLPPALLVGVGARIKSRIGRR